jgi:hypothetical protein
MHLSAYRLILSFCVRKRNRGSRKFVTNEDVLQVIQVVLDEIRGKDRISASFSSVELGCPGGGPVTEGSRHSIVDGRSGDTSWASLNSNTNSNWFSHRSRRKFTSYLHRYPALLRNDYGHVHASCSSLQYYLHREDERETLHEHCPFSDSVRNAGCPTWILST